MLIKDLLLIATMSASLAANRMLGVRFAIIIFCHCPTGQVLLYYQVFLQTFPYVQCF